MFYEFLLQQHVENFTSFEQQIFFVLDCRCQQLPAKIPTNIFCYFNLYAYACISLFVVKNVQNCVYVPSLNCWVNMLQMKLNFITE